jgi:hypothetical protein
VQCATLRFYVLETSESALEAPLVPRLCHVPTPRYAPQTVRHLRCDGWKGPPNRLCLPYWCHQHTQITFDFRFTLTPAACD